MTKLNPWLRTFISLALYIAVYYVIFDDLRSIGLLVLVIIIHETGHYLAMRAFGYSNLQMLFVPMLGAFVSGKPARIDPGKRLIVLLAGPVPGLVLGTMFGMIYSYHHQYLFYLLSLMFILLNLFNLIPVTPMDGGQILTILFPKAHRQIQSVFMITLAVVMIYFLFDKKFYFLTIPLLLLAMRFFRIWQNKLSFNNDQNETEPHVELSRNEKMMFIAIWLLAIIVPLQTLYRVI